MSNFMEYKLDNEFPFNIIEYKVNNDKDKLHWHDYLEIGLCIKGKGKFIFSDKVYNVSEGDIFIVSNFENHVAISENAEQTTYLFIFFLSDLIAPPGSRMFDFQYLSPFWYDSGNFCNKIDNSTKEAIMISESMLEIKEIHAQKQEGYKHLVDSNLRRILAYLIRYYRTTDSEFYNIKLNNRMRIQPILNHINNHLNENITLKDLSCMLNMSESRFRHFFKETTGIGFKEYVSYMRVNQAKEILITTDKSISDIVYEIGYTNIYQFYKLFNKYVSMTPADYRKHHKNKIIYNVLSKIGYELDLERNCNNIIKGT